MLDKLEYLIALSREQHFGRAAEFCGVTQPTLSAGIKQLEETLGVLLVQRGSRFIGFTAEGERTLDWARRIVGDARAMRDEIKALRHGLSGQLRIAAIPTALAMVAQLTTPFRARHPDVRFSILSRTSIEMLTLLDNLEIDAGVTYLDNEPLGRVNAVPLYQERYQLLTARRRAARQPRARHLGRGRAGAALPAHARHAEPPHHRRPVARRRRRRAPTLESNSIIVLFAHVRTGRWASVMPARLAETLGLTATIRAIPIVEPEAVHTIGLVVPPREPMTPLTAALVVEAKRLAAGTSG